jgi:hypothetical protein
MSTNDRGINDREFIVEVHRKRVENALPNAGLDQRRKRVCTDFQFGYCSGRSRQGAPLLNTHRIALTMMRLGRG